MRSSDVLPTIRSAPAARALTPEEIRELRALHYQQYLQSDWWRQRRNIALRAAHYRCARCGVNRQLNVHHLSYERLGAEVPEDLEVLCRGCHVGEHFNETQTYISLYTRVLSGILAEQHSTDITEIIEEGKARCAEYGLPYRHHEYQAAVSTVLPRVPFAPPPQKVELFERSTRGQPFTRAEASSILAALGIADRIRHVPEVSREEIRDGMTYIEALEDPEGRAEAAAHEAAVRNGTLPVLECDSDAAWTLRYIRSVSKLLERRSIRKPV